MSHEGGEDNATYDAVLSEWSGGERKTHATNSLLERWVAAAATAAATADAAGRAPVGANNGALAVAMADLANSASLIDPTGLLEPTGSLGAADSADGADMADFADSEMDAGWIFVGASTLAVACLAGIYQLEHQRRRKLTASATAPAAPEQLTTFARIAPSR